MIADRTGPLRHPYLLLLLLPLFFVLHGIGGQYPHIRVADVAYLLPIYWLAGALLAGAAWLFVRRIGAAVLIAFGILSIYFFFGAFHDFLKAHFGESGPARYSVLLPLLLLCLVAWIVIIRREAAFGNLLFYLNVLLLILVLVDSVTWAMAASREPGAPQVTASNDLHPCKNCPRPDIYLIVADGYAGNVELKRRLQFDNSAFLDTLRARGFFVADSSRSNYNFTPFSMASMLNLDYLPIGKYYTLSAEKDTCNPMIAHNRFWRYLEQQGYALRNLSIFPVAGQLPPVYSPFFRTGEELLTGQTLSARINRDIRSNLAYRYHWKSELKRYAHYEVRAGNKTVLQRTLEESRRRSTAPRFVYSHLIMPHDPYFYRKDGSENPVELLADYQKTTPGIYLGYLQYASARYLELVDGILRNSAQPPVIILMSDHGYRGTNQHGVPAEDQLLTLNAVYLPSRRYEGWYAGISNVNQLRVFLNTQFDQRLPLLKDSIAYLYEKQP